MLTIYKWTYGGLFLMRSKFLFFFSYFLEEASDAIYFKIFQSVENSCLKPKMWPLEFPTDCMWNRKMYNYFSFSLIYFLLDEILSSSVHRCLEPNLMEPNAVEIICERG